MRSLARKLILKLGVAIHRLDRQIAQATLPTFANAPQNASIQLPREIRNSERIYLGDGVRLGPGSVLKAITRYPGGSLRHPEGKHVEQTFEPVIRIGHRVTATASLHVAALQEITIEDDVMFASNVFMCDGLHGYESADVPFKFQGMRQIAPITIGKGCWVGQNVVILPGVTIGEYAIIGANSVVSKDVPAQSIAMGTPARVAKRWEASSQAWLPVTPEVRS